MRPIVTPTRKSHPSCVPLPLSGKRVCPTRPIPDGEGRRSIEIVINMLAGVVKGGDTSILGPELRRIGQSRFLRITSERSTAWEDCAKSASFSIITPRSRSGRTSVVIDHPSRYEASHEPGDAVLIGRNAIGLSRVSRSSSVSWRITTHSPSRSVYSTFSWSTSTSSIWPR
jgi:hypothetical protein